MLLSAFCVHVGKDAARFPFKVETHKFHLLKVIFIISLAYETVNNRLSADDCLFPLIGNRGIGLKTNIKKKDTVCTFFLCMVAFIHNCISEVISLRSPTVHYNGFRLSRIREPQFSHLLYLTDWIFYLLSYVLTEQLISYQRCHLIHCTLDDLIPFCEWFIIPYVFWYFFVAGTLLLFLLYDVKSFRTVMKYIIYTQIVATIIFIVYPSRQELRPTFFERSNAATWLLGLIYSIDTSTNVCPSLHVTYSIAVCSTWLRKQDIRVGWKIAIVACTILICLSTAMVKQHSVIDIVTAVFVCFFAELWLFFRKPYHKNAAVSG